MAKLYPPQLDGKLPAFYNTYNSDNELQLYISEYNPEDDECVVQPISEYEYNKIKTEINSILLTLKNENEKIDINEND